MWEAEWGNVVVIFFFSCSPSLFFFFWESIDNRIGRKFQMVGWNREICRFRDNEVNGERIKMI